MSFRPAIVVSSNPINFISVHSLQQQHTHVKCALTKLNGLGSQLWQAEVTFIQALFKMIRENLRL